MRKYRPTSVRWIAIIILAMTVILVENMPGSAVQMEPTIEHLSILIVYDNNQHQPGLATDWGFSCLIRADEQVILFDAGGDGKMLLANMKKLDIDPAQVRTVFLSHHHRDHIGGLDEFLAKHADVDVLYPATMAKSFADQIKKSGARPVAVSESVSLAPGIRSTGLIQGSIPEQALVINAKDGLVIVTGCAHPGIVTVVKRAQILSARPIQLVLGGFHMFRMSLKQQQRIVADLQKLGVQQAAPCHCSGDTARRCFQQAFGKNYIAVGVGKRIER